MPNKNKSISFFHYRRIYARSFWTGLLFLAATNILDVTPPLILKRGLDQIQAHQSRDELLKTALIFILVTVLLAVCRYHWRMLWGNYHLSASRDLRERLFEKLTELGPRFYRRNNVGQIMSLMTNDIESYRMGIGPGVLVLVDAILYFVTIPFLMFQLSVPLTFMTLVCVPFLPFLINRLGNVIHRRSALVQQRLSELSSFVQENVTGIRLIKSFSQEDTQLKELNRRSENLKKASLSVARADGFMHPTMEFAVATGVVILLYFGGQKLATGALTVGTFVAFHRYITKMAWPMTAMGWGASLIQQGRSSLERINSVLATPPEINEVHAAGAFADSSIAIRGLSFNYHGSSRKALDHLDLDIAEGETIGITGPVGSGKSTLALLLGKLYDVPSETIFIGGRDITQISCQQLRRHVTLVTQDSFLFSDKVVENIRFGTEAPRSMDMVNEVIRTARLEDELSRLPQGFDTTIGERGIGLSGGQRQRVAVARALLRRTPIVIFDDSLSAVDAETEKLILLRMGTASKNLGFRQTRILITHRPTTLAFCDRVVVINNGKVENLVDPGKAPLGTEAFVSAKAAP